MDSWRVKNVFKSNNEVSYKAVSSYMFKLTDQPTITEGISFDSYRSTKKFLLCMESDQCQNPQFKTGMQKVKSRIQNVKA